MSDENGKNLPAVGRQNLPSGLHNNGLRAGPLLDQAWSRLTNEQAQNLLGEAAKKALELEAKNREQNMDYDAAKRAVELHVDTFNMIDKQGPLARQKVNTNVKTGAGNMHIESKSGPACFVATVAYGDCDHPDVVFLRQYRDNVLQRSPLGRSFINWYWRNGPRIASAVERSKTLRSTSKFMISKIVVALIGWGYARR